jgi:hypothetical protein
MSELNYIGAGELVFNSDQADGIHSGGFSVDSIMMKAGMSPIRTLNGGGADTEALIGGSHDSKVSDLFSGGLAVPNWVLSYNNRIGGGKYKEVEHDDSDSDDSVVDDDLHDRLLELVKEHNAKVKAKEKEKEALISKKKITRRTKTVGSKKGITKRRR